MSAAMRSRRARLSMGVRAYRLRREPPDRPAVATALVSEAIVEAVQSPLPELHGDRRDPVPAPERGSRDVVARVAGVERGDALHQLVARDELRALPRGPRADPRLARPSGEVGVGLLGADGRDVAGHGDLTVELSPVDGERRPRILGELETLAAPVVRVEGEAVVLDAAEEDVA